MHASVTYVKNLDYLVNSKTMHEKVEVKTTDSYKVPQLAASVEDLAMHGKIERMFLESKADKKRLQSEPVVQIQDFYEGNGKMHVHVGDELMLNVSGKDPFDLGSWALSLTSQGKIVFKLDVRGNAGLGQVSIQSYSEGMPIFEEHVPAFNLSGNKATLLLRFYSDTIEISGVRGWKHILTCSIGNHPVSPIFVVQGFELYTASISVRPINTLTPTKHPTVVPTPPTANPTHLPTTKYSPTASPVRTLMPENPPGSRVGMVERRVGVLEDHASVTAASQRALQREVERLRRELMYVRTSNSLKSDQLQKQLADVLKARAAATAQWKQLEMMKAAEKAMAMQMHKCLASGKSIKKCEAEGISACIATGLLRQECTQMFERLYDVYQAHKQLSASNAIDMVAQMRKCLIAGKSLAKCKADVVRACLARKLRDGECTKAADFSGRAALWGSTSMPSATPSTSGHLRYQQH